MKQPDHVFKANFVFACLLQPEAARQTPSDSGGLSGLAFLSAQDAALDNLSFHRELAVRRADQERVQTAVMLNRADALGGQTQTNARAENVGEQSDFLQVRQEATTGLVVGVADVVARQHTLARDLAAA